ncbi:TPA: polymerase [Streptococcus suis]|nr:polymerase [Streptococcus suis]
MKIRINQNFLNECLVYCGISMYLVVSMLSTTFFSKFIPGSLVHLVSIISIFLIILHNINATKNGVSFFGGLFIFGIMSLLIYLSLGSFQNYIYSLIIIFLLKDFDFNKLVKVVLPVIITVFVFIIVCSKLGIVQDYVEISMFRIRHYLGFRYSLFSSTIMLNIVALYLYSKQELISYKSIIILSISVLWIYNQTGSRLTTLSSLLLILLILLIKVFPNFLKKVQYSLMVLIPSYFIGAILSYIVADNFMSAGNAILMLNNFLGGRIYLASKSLYIYGFSWLGKNIQWVGNGLNAEGQRSSMSYLYVDNMYIQILQKFGFLYLIIFLTLFTVALYKLYRQKQFFLFLILSVLAFHAMIDDLTFNLHYNFFLLLLAYPFSVRSIKHVRSNSS